MTTAVSTRALGNRYPLARYMGGKGKFAKRILEALEVDEVDRVVLVDPGPWGEAWSVIASDHDTLANELEKSLALDPASLYSHIISDEVADSRMWRVADFLILQTLNWRSKPVGVKDGQWVTHGLDKTMAYGVKATPRFGEVKPQLPNLVKRLRGLKGLKKIEAHHCRAEEVQPIDDAIVYIDPPYDGCTGYQHDLSREAVLGLAWEWRNSRVVAISEAEPMPGYGAVCVGARGKTSGINRSAGGVDEWLSVSGLSDE